MMRDALNIVEFSAIALGRSAGSSTISTTNAWRAGVSNALITPWKSCSRMICVTVIAAAHRAARASVERLQRRQHLGDEKDPPAVPAVADHAAERREHQQWNLTSERDNAEEKLGTGEPEHEPARRHARDPRSDEGKRLSAEEQAIVPVPERADQLARSRVAHRTSSSSVARRGRQMRWKFFSISRRVMRSTTGRPWGQTLEYAVRRSSSRMYRIFSIVSG